MIRTGFIIMMCAILANCASMDRLKRIGEPPELTAIKDPVSMPTNNPVSVSIPLPADHDEVSTRTAGSLWQNGRKSFFKDLRANDVGDLLTVLVSIDDEATLENTSERSRSNEDSLSAPNVLGFESYVGNILPDAADINNLVSTESELSNSSDGTIERVEEIDLRVAAMVTQKLPNGNLVIVGRQEVRVNFEVRELQVAGIIRQRDITNDNTISYDQIAEARISYGGRGHLSDIQGARYGSEFLDIILPF